MTKNNFFFFFLFFLTKNCFLDFSSLLPFQLFVFLFFFFNNLSWRQPIRPFKINSVFLCHSKTFLFCLPPPPMPFINKLISLFFHTFLNHLLNERISSCCRPSIDIFRPFSLPSQLYINWYNRPTFHFILFHCQPTLFFCAVLLIAMDLVTVDSKRKKNRKKNSLNPFK